MLLVDEIVMVYAQQNKHRQIRWQVHALPEVWGDAAMLHLVFCNLIDNAVKFTSRRPVAVIEIGHNENNDNYVIFVKDNGIGFDMQYHDQIFGSSTACIRRRNSRARASAWPTCSG